MSPISPMPKFAAIMPMPFASVSTTVRVASNRFAFPPNQQKRGPWKPNTPPPPRTKPRAIGNQGTDILVRGVLQHCCASHRRSFDIRRALAGLFRAIPAHARLLSAMLDSALSYSGKETLDSAALLTILGDDLYNMAQALLQGGGTAFGFNRQSGSGELAGAQAFRQLDEAIRLMKQRPELGSSTAKGNRIGEH
jgi:hypothetical protein